MEEKERYLARCDYERERDRRRRVTPPVSSTFIALALPHLLPFRPPPPPLFLSLSLSVSCLASQHTLSPIMPVSLRPLSSHSLRLSATLTTEQPQESMHPGSLLPAANDPTFQAFSVSVSPLSSFSPPVSISLSLPLCRSFSFSSSSSSLTFSLSMHPSSSRVADLPACTLNLHTHQRRYATSVCGTGEVTGHRPAWMNMRFFSQTWFSFAYAKRPCLCADARACIATPKEIQSVPVARWTFAHLATACSFHALFKDEPRHLTFS